MSQELNSICNSKRRNILQRKDRQENVSNAELQMYGLTAYFSNETSDCSFYEKVLYAKRENNKVLHIGDKNIYLMDEQLRALELIIEKDKMILMAPTSFGKTLLVKEYIYRFKPVVAVIIVPTNSLAYELEMSFKKNNSFSDYIIFDKTKLANISSKEKLLFVGTQEKFLEIENKLKKIDLFVVDEAYKLKESTLYQRSYRLSKVFLDNAITKSRKVLLLSPNAKFNGFESYDFHYESITFNCVEKFYDVLDADSFYKKLNEKAKTEKTILFCKSPGDVNAIYNNIDKFDSNLNRLCKFLSNEFHPEWSVVKLLEKGVLVHHGQMPKFVQNKMQNLFIENEHCNLLIGTNSLSEGINTPTKNIFISPTFNSKDDVMLLKNTVGRAGRLGKYPIGYIYSTRDIEEECNKENEIFLAVSNDDDLNEIKESNDELKIKSKAELYGISPDHIKFLVKSHSISLSKLCFLLDILKEDCNFLDTSNVLFMASKVFKKDYPIYYFLSDKIFLKAMFQSFVKLNNKIIRIDTFQEKMEYCSSLNKIEISKAIDEYMAFAYSRLEYCALPLAKICSFIKDNYSTFKFGKNVAESCSDFLRKYYLSVYGNLDINSLSETETQILQVMREYGISIKKLGINDKMVEEIAEKLENNFSTFDIINAIIELAESESSYKNTFKLISNYYIG